MESEESGCRVLTSVGLVHEWSPRTLRSSSEGFYSSQRFSVVLTVFPLTFLMAPECHQLLSSQIEGSVYRDGPTSATTLTWVL